MLPIRYLTAGIYEVKPTSGRNQKLKPKSRNEIKTETKNQCKTGIALLVSGLHQ